METKEIIPVKRDGEIQDLPVKEAEQRSGCAFLFDGCAGGCVTCLVFYTLFLLFAIGGLALLVFFFARIAGGVFMTVLPPA